MPTWKSRGLRGSTLEELINRSNERYQELGLALIQKIPTPITPINIEKETRHITLAYFDQKTISVLYRGFLFALMPRNVLLVLLLSKTSIHTRFASWRILKNRMESHFFLFILLHLMNFIICLTGNCRNSGTEQKTEAEKALEEMSLMMSSSLNLLENLEF